MSRASLVLSVGALLLLLSCARPAAAHVIIDTPAAGSFVPMGQVVTISWEDVILHEGIGYDIDFIPNGDLEGEADVVAVAHGLPVSTHSFSWLTPNARCDNCYLKVTQVNVGISYLDAISISLVPASSIDGPPDPAGGASAGGASNGGASGQTGGAAASSAGAPASAAGAPSTQHHYGTSAAGAASGGASSGPVDSGSGAGTSEGGGATAGAADPAQSDPPDEAADGEAGQRDSAVSSATTSGCSMGQRSTQAWLPGLGCLGLLGLGRRRDRARARRRER